MLGSDQAINRAEGGAQASMSVRDGVLSSRRLGFLYVFHTYNPKQSSSVVEKVVSFLTGSEIIHVEMLPVVEAEAGPGGEVTRVAVSTSYTAYLFCRFNTFEPSICAEESSIALYVPMTEAQTEAGEAFLQGLVGARYNYWNLPCTMLPTAVKECLPHQQQQHRQRVFCSQAGLQLCYACGVLDQEHIPPFCCSPKELHALLLEHGKATPWAKDRILILPSVS